MKANKWILQRLKSMFAQPVVEAHELSGVYSVLDIVENTLCFVYILPLEDDTSSVVISIIFGSEICVFGRTQPSIF